MHETSVYNWESNRNSPSPKFIPKIVRFLGYIPFKALEVSNDPIERLKYYKQIHGLSYKKLEKLMGKAP